MFPPLGFWAAGTATTFAAFNPSDITGSVSLSNSNRTAAATGPGLVRSTDSYIRGKWYWEVTTSGLWTNGQTGVGVGHGSTIHTGANSIGSSGFGGAFIFNDGVIFHGTNSGFTCGTLPGVCRIGVAVDLDKSLAWFRVNGGNWNGNAGHNPATSAGGITLYGTLGTRPAFRTFSTNGATPAITMNTGATAFVDAVPSGFGTSGNNTPFVSTQKVNYGVNLRGADFTPANRPGTYGTDYEYPNAAEMNYFSGKGMGIVRLGFLWERLQTAQNAALNSAEAARMDTFINYARTKGLKVVLDPWNFNRYYGVSVGISGGVPNSSFADFWSRVATRYLSASFDHVIFGLTNEPHDTTTAEWTATANAAIAAIRATGSTNRISVPANNFATASIWWTGDNDTVFGPNIVDSGNNYMIELHQYLDAAQSGETDLVVSTTIGSERLHPVTAWARANNNKKLYLGEMGVGQSADSLACLDDMCDYLDANADVWEAATYWAAGPWWSSAQVPPSTEFWVIEPANLNTTPIDKPQMGVLVQHIQAPAGGGSAFMLDAAGTSGNITLSNGNLTATATTATEAVTRGSAALSGKDYFEATIQQWNGAYDRVGICIPGAVASSLAQLCTGGILLNLNGDIAMNGSVVSSAIGPQSWPFTVGIAVDVPNTRIWFRVGAAGAWNGAAVSGDPAAGTGFHSFSGLGGTDFRPCSTLSATSNVITFNFGATSFLGAVPSGYSAPTAP